MTPRQSRRPTWRRTENHTWTLSLGERGCRVRLFENRDKGGIIYREVQIPGGRSSRCSLGTRDKTRAKNLAARSLPGSCLARNRRCAPAPLDSALSASDSSRNRRCSSTIQRRPGATHAAPLEILLAQLRREPRRAQPWRERRAPVRSAASNRRDSIRRRHDLRVPCGSASVQADVKLLKQLLYWACSVTHDDGSRLLERNPLEYVRVNGEHDVVRPIASFERFQATRGAMHEFQRRYAEEARTLQTEGDRARAKRRELSWIRAELALVLLEATGKRRSSIVGLHWSDFDHATQRLTWRPEHDKKAEDLGRSVSHRHFSNSCGNSSVDSA